MASQAAGQSYTLAPYPRLQFFTNTGAVCNGCLLNAYLTGSSTRRDTYSDTSGTANANPVVLSSSGRATVYLAVGVSYRMVLTDSTGATTYFDVDPVTAVPASAGNLDITVTAGEALVAGNIVYLSDGSGALTSGRWYLADADNTYASNTAGLVGIATGTIASAGTGTVRIAGRMTGLSGLTTGEFYYASATAGGLTATPPTNQRFIGQADSTTTLVLHGDAGSVKLPDSDGTHTLAFLTTSNLTADRRITVLPGDSNRQLTLSGDATIDQDLSTSANPSFNRFERPQGRCTLTSATPVTVGDVTAATTLYYALYAGNQITLYDGASSWVRRSFSQLSIAVPATTNTVYDVFVDHSLGTPALEVVAWSSDTARATALTTQNGVYVQTSDTDSLYVCSFRTTGVSGQTEDSFAKRYVWNYYNRVTSIMRVSDATNSWTATGLTLAQANASTANQLDFVIGVAESPLSVDVIGAGFGDSVSDVLLVGIGIDSTSALATGQINGRAVMGTDANEQFTVTAHLDTYPAIGRHIAVWLEAGSATTNFLGDDGTTTIQTGISGRSER